MHASQSLDLALRQRPAAIVDAPLADRRAKRAAMLDRAVADDAAIVSLRGGRDLAKLDRRAVGFALFTAVTICAYSVVDGVGARLAGTANAYSAALFVGIGPVMAIYALVRNGAGALGDAGRLWRTGLAGGALQLGSYGIAIWAMTVAPIAIVAALRETSVLFAALFGATLLREPMLPLRLLAAALVLAGALLLRFR